VGVTCFWFVEGLGFFGRVGMGVLESGDGVKRGVDRDCWRCGESPVKLVGYPSLGSCRTGTRDRPDLRTLPSSDMSAKRIFAELRLE